MYGLPWSTKSGKELDGLCGPGGHDPPVLRAHRFARLRDRVLPRLELRDDGAELLLHVHLEILVELGRRDLQRGFDGLRRGLARAELVEHRLQPCLAEAARDVFAREAGLHVRHDDLLLVRRAG